MKRLIYLFGLILLLSACEDWLDINTDADVPTDVPGEMVLPSAEVALGTVLGGSLFNTGGFLAQYWTQAPEASQYQAIDIYDINNPFLNNEYSTIFAGTLEDCKLVIENAEANKEWGLYLAATVVRAYTYQVFIDMVDRTPYSEALQGDRISNPKWEDGEEVYQSLINEIDTALYRVATEPVIFATSYDLILKSDLKKWIQFANTLKLKFFMRESEKTDRNKANLAQLIAEDNLIREDVKLACWADESGKQNPWYSTNTNGLKTDNHVAAYPIVTYLKVNNDPRMEKLFQPSVNGSDYAGLVPGGTAIKGEKKKDYSYPMLRIQATWPVYLITQAEVAFFKAEYYLKNGDDANAQAAYEEGVRASFALHGIPAAAETLLAGNYKWDGSLSTGQKMEKIMMQKWVALCMVNNLESWSEIRRTGYPKMTDKSATAIVEDPSIYTPGMLISPIGNYLGAMNQVNRFPYPETATIRNKNTPEQPGITAKIWWDVN